MKIKQKWVLTFEFALRLRQSALKMEVLTQISAQTRKQFRELIKTQRQHKKFEMESARFSCRCPWRSYVGIVVASCRVPGKGPLSKSSTLHSKRGPLIFCYEIVRNRTKFHRAVTMSTWVSVRCVPGGHSALDEHSCVQATVPIFPYWPFPHLFIPHVIYLAP